MELGIMAMKRYSTLLTAPELEPYHQKHFTVISRTPLSGLIGSFTRLQRIQSAYCKLTGSTKFFSHFFYIY